MSKLLEVNTGNFSDINYFNITPNRTKAATSSFQGQKQMSIKPIFYPNKPNIIDKVSQKEFSLTQEDI